MSVIDHSETTSEMQAPYEPESPFSEVNERIESTVFSSGFTPWAEVSTPFAESAGEVVPGQEAQNLIAEAMEQLYDENFDEALVDLVSETENVISERVSDEATEGYADQRAAVGEAHLAPLTYEAHRYLDNLASGLASLDVASLSEQQLDEVLDRFDPTPGELSPAGEQFIGALIRKAKKAVSWVVKTAGTVGKAVTGAIGGVLGGILKKLYALVKPLLRRVLGMAIGRLPAPLQPAARALAQRIGLEAEGEAEAPSALAADPEQLAEQFDEIVAEMLTSPEEALAELEAFGASSDAAGEGEADGRELEQLAQARGALIDTIASAGEGENLGPAIEQFVPALLGALRLGISVVGRPKVVNFLAGYLSKLIGQWVGPAMAGPLSNAIVDTGLRLITLEQGTGESQRDEVVPVMLAATIEDTVRNLAENESYVFENEALLQAAMSESFDRAVATTFPSRFVRARLQSAPSLAGSFVQRGPRTIAPFRKYTSRPEVSITDQMADSLTSFGGVSLGASLRAHGYRLPMRARVHIYEATVGTSLRTLVMRDRSAAGLASGRRPWTKLHPLTPQAAATLLQEPALGVPVPQTYLHSRSRVAAGQRFYYLEPLAGGSALGGALGGAVTGGIASLPAVAARALPPQASQGWVTIDLRRSRVVVDLFFSEVDAQQIATMSRGPGGPAQVLKAMRVAWAHLARSFEHPDGRIRIVKEMEEGEAFLGPLLRRMPPALLTPLHRHIREWVMRSLSTWVGTSIAEFTRAASDPSQGVTVRVTLLGLPGLDSVRAALSGRLSLAALGTARAAAIRKAAPTVTVVAFPGRRRMR